MSFEGEVINVRGHAIGTRSRAAAGAAAIALAIGACGGSEDEGAAAGEPAGGEATAADPARLDHAVHQYDAYVERNAAELVEGTERFVALVDAGDVEGAKEIYSESRLPFERIEPVAGAFGDLDPDIDGREGDIPADDWGGYHRIEKALWVDESTDGMRPVTTELVSDVRNLQDIAVKADFEPGEIAQGSVDLLGEVSASKITGEEERYSRTDLWDFLANVQGAEAGFEALEPAVREVDPELADEVASQFEQTPRGARRVSPRGWLRPLLRALDRRHGGALAAHRRARRAALAGRGGGRMTPDVTRRGLLKSAGVAGAGLGLGAGGYALGRATRRGRLGRHRDRPLLGRAPGGDRHRGAGPAALRRLRRHHDDAGPSFVDLLAAWTVAAARMTAGEPAGYRNDDPLLPPEDTGEAVGHLPSRLTIAFGLRAVAVRRALRARDESPGRPARASDAPRRGARARRARAATSAFRRAPTTPRSPSTRSAT